MGTNKGIYHVESTEPQEKAKGNRPPHFADFLFVDTFEVLREAKEIQTEKELGTLGRQGIPVFWVDVSVSPVEFIVDSWGVTIP